ncbi:MAG: TatD family hydrolase [Planctomycetes bacterium]|nr:TatD family hydrolase [Planctomycetota bacterium]
MGLIDTHAHLTFPELRDQIDAVLARCDEAGVERVITVGTDLDDAENAIDLARRYPGRIHAAVGVHPHEAENVSESDLDKIIELWDDPAVVGLGEMGLDYHYDFADQGVQRKVLARQLAAASSRSQPLVIHCREAFDDILPLLLEHGFDQQPAVFHCFTGTATEALKIAEHGWRISFTGIVTFPRSTELQEIARSYPNDALMIETDSPYLSPVPVRGVRPNEPSHVAHVAGFLAQLRGVSLEELTEQTRRNSMAFFGL